MPGTFTPDRRIDGTGHALDVFPLKFLRNLGRSREIVTVLLNYGFGDVVDRLHLVRYLQWWRGLFHRRRHAPETESLLTRPQRIRMAIEDLGPTFIKFGQVVSTRPDLVPPNIIHELEKLQEGVPPFPGAVAQRILEEELEAPVAKLFASFSVEPMAAGSLGQVHEARHHDGTRLAIKIRRPTAVHDVERDLSLMTELALLLERHLPEAEIFDPVGLVQQFSRSIRRELSFTREARTIDEFRRLFRNDATLFVPRVYWDLTTDAVLTMEYVDGMHIHDHDALLAEGISPQELAANGARIFLKMAFEFGFFHGDPHPGNIRILTNGVYGLIDYGMVGRLDEDKREQLIDLFVAVTQGDVRGTVEQVLLLGKPSRSVDRPLLQSDVRDFIEGYYGLSLERINVGNLLSDYVGILSNHGIRYPADLMLLIRATVTLEGVGRELDPGFNLAEHLAPVVHRLVRERYNPQRVAGRLLSEAKALLNVLHDFPVHVGKTLEKLSNDDLRIHLEHRHLEHLITELDRSSNRIVIGLVMSALIMASALVIRTTGTTTWWISVPAFLLSSFLGIWLIYGVFRSGRL